jgi:hypothetical protein
MSHNNQVPCASSFASASKTKAETLDEINARDLCKTEVERSLSTQIYQSKDSKVFSTTPKSERIGKTFMKKRPQPEKPSDNPKEQYSNRDSLLAHHSRLQVYYKMKSIVSTISDQKQRQQTLESRLRTTLESVLHLMKIDQKDECNIRKYLFARAVNSFSKKQEFNTSFEELDLIGKRSDTKQEIQEKFRVDKLLIDHYLTSQGSKKLIKGTEKAASVNPDGPKQRPGNLLLKWSQTEEEINEKVSFCTTLFGSEKFDEQLLSLASRHQKASMQDK